MNKGDPFDTNKMVNQFIIELSKIIKAPINLNRNTNLAKLINNVITNKNLKKSVDEYMKMKMKSRISKNS